MLTSDKLRYYKYEGGKRDSCLRGSILLRDCEVICPFLDYENRPVSSTFFFHSKCDVSPHLTELFKKNLSVKELLENPWINTWIKAVNGSGAR